MDAVFQETRWDHIHFDTFIFVSNKNIHLNQSMSCILLRYPVHLELNIVAIKAF